MLKLIERDEWWPVYCIEPYSERYKEICVDVPDELIQRYEKLMKEFSEMQNILSKLYNE